MTLGPPRTQDYEVIDFDVTERVPMDDWERDTDAVVALMKERAIFKIAQWIVDEGLVQIRSDRRFDTMEYMVNHRIKVLKEK